MYEVIVNSHVHTYLSDGHASYQEIAEAAIKAGLDAVILTDHNVFVRGMDRFYHSNGKKVLLLAGLEVHDQLRYPQKNHLLAFFPTADLSRFASEPSQLIQHAISTGALTFLAHPVDPEMRAFGEPDISWVDWEIKGYTGIELWNGFSEIKGRSRNILDTIFYAFFPHYLAHQPLTATLKLWDDLIAKGKPCVAIGGSDAHALQKKALWFTKTIFPYAYHFRAINNHLQIENPLSDHVEIAKIQLYEAFSRGRSFIGYELPFPTKGFSFCGQGMKGTVQMGETSGIKGGITFHVHLPALAECTLLKDGHQVKIWKNSTNCTYITDKPGVYRVEVYTHYLGKRRGWIYSNPIYARNDDGK
ncbi:MAG: hypothetical protein C0391_03470 [Anaerolinea sp.]|nr:hypothetical protein [Anaerolinea sp.]